MSNPGPASQVTDNNALLTAASLPAALPSVLPAALQTAGMTGLRTIGKSMLIVGDSILQGGNATGTAAVTALSGNGYQGRITLAVDWPVGSTFLMHGVLQPEWNGRKTITSNNGATITFVNPTTLTAAPTVDPLFGTVNFASDASTNQRNVMKILNGRLGLPFSNILMNAMSGSQTPYQLARYDTDSAGYSYDVLVMLSGHNDIITNPADDLTPFTNMAAMAQKALAAGAEVWILGGTPFTAAGGSGTGGNATAQRQQTKVRLDRRLRRFALATPGITWVDTRKRLGNNQSADWKAAGSVYTNDGVHPSCFAAWELADEAFLTLQYRLTRPWPLISNDLDNFVTDSLSTQMIPDPLLSASTASGNAGMTGNVWTNWAFNQYAGAPTATLSVVAAPDGVGNSQHVVVSAAAANDQIRFVNPNTTLFNTFLAANVGKRAVIAIAFAQASVPANTLAGINAYYEMVAGGLTTRVFLSTGDGTNGISQAGTYAIRSEPFIIPAGITNTTLQMIMQFSGVGTGATFDFWRPSLDVIN